MEEESQASVNAFDPSVGSGPCVKAVFRLGSQTYYVDSGNKEMEIPLSVILTSTKDEIMGILKEYITAHNVPNDVPYELVESCSEEDENDEIPEEPPVKSKKTKLTFG